MLWSNEGTVWHKHVFKLGSHYLIGPNLVGLNFSSVLILVTSSKFSHLGPTKNLGRPKFGPFMKFQIDEK